MHPTIDALLSGEADAVAHAASCAACRAVRELATSARHEADVDELPVVDRALFTDWRELEDGRGGMGTTYRVRDRRLGRDVAVKQIAYGDRPPGERGALRRRFEREVRLTASLQHPAIVTVHEAGRFDDGEPFYAMPLVRGDTLDRALAERPSLRERLALLANMTVVCDAIAYAHGQGVVHRDLKPGNILVGPFGETVVIDWGVASELDARGALATHDAPADGMTRLGVGTAPYMAPEQARGDPASPAMDVYALGATLYQVLAGEPPPAGARAAGNRGRSVREHVPEVPPELADIVDRAMAPDPEARFATAAELADELRRFQTGQLLTSRSYTLGEIVRHFVARHRAAVRVAALALVVFVVAGTAAVVMIARERDRARLGERAARAELHRARGAMASMSAARPTGRLDAHELAVLAVAPALAAGEQPGAEALRGLEDAIAAGPVAAVLPGHVGTGLQLAVTDDGRRLITLADDGALRVWDARTGAPLATWRTAIERPYAVAVSPAGERAAIGAHGPHIDVIELGTGASSVLAGGGAAVPWVAWRGGDVVSASAAGDLVLWREGVAVARGDTGASATGLAVRDDGVVAVAALDGSVALWDPDGDAIRVLRGHAGEVRGAVFTDDGALITGGADGRVLRWAIENAAPATELVRFDHPVHGVRVSPAGRHLALSDGAAWLLDLAGDRELQFAEGMFGYRHTMATDGRLATCSTRGVHVWSAAGDELALLGQVPPHGRCDVAITPGGDRVVSATERGDTWLWDARMGAVTGTLPSHVGEVVAIAVAPAGDAVATGGSDGVARIVDVRDGRVRARARGAEVTSVAWLDGDGAVVGTIQGEALRLRAGGAPAVAGGGEPVSVAAAADGTGIIALAGFDGALRVLGRDGAQVAAFHHPAGAALTAVAVSRRGLVAFGDARGGVWMWADGAARRLDRSGDAATGVASVAFSPDGDRVLVGRAGGPSEIYTAGGELRAAVAGAAVAWLGDEAVTALPDGRVIVHGLDGARRELVGHGALVLAGDGSATAAVLATGDADGVVIVWDRSTGVARLRYATALGACTALAVTPDGAWVVAGFATGAVRVFPTTPALAVRRACGVLAGYARLGAVSGYCR